MTDFLDRLERQLITAACAPLTQAAPTAHRTRRLTPLVATVLVLVAGGAAALAASGVLTGTPVKPTGPLSPSAGSGIPARGGSQLLSLRVADPAGGLPWGMRIVHTTRGYVCLQIGRLHDGQLGELGTDGAFHDDGRFHPLPPDVLPPEGELGGNPQCVLPNQAFSSTLFDYDSNAAPPNGRSVPPASQREIAFGLLGPTVLSVSYATANGDRTTRVQPRTGAFLIVQRPSEPGQEGSIGSSAPLNARLGTGPLPNGMLTAITYRYDGRACSISRSLHTQPGCPQPGGPYSATPAFTRNLNEPLHVTLDIRDHVVYGAHLEFKAPYTVASAATTYQVEMPLQAACHRGGGVSVTPVNRDVARGSMVNVNLPNVFANSCTRSQTLTVVFAPAPATEVPVMSTIIGTITIHEPPGTKTPATPPTR